jgi:site-specific DNA-methyltransferase (adenine-specific)
MIRPVYDEKRVTIYHSHSLFAMMAMRSNSVDSIVTDPPYGLSFMGKKWDYDVPSVQLWREALRVLKPGGHLLAFAGSRTYHRMAVNIEDAGFEVRDQIMWIYGSGFPKSHDISKAIDKAAGVEREVVGHKRQGFKPDSNKVYGKFSGDTSVTKPATPEAKQWEGWGTALKPAHEPIVVARKPVEGTVAENVLKYGTGGINIDGARIETSDEWEGREMPEAEDGVTWGGDLNTQTSASHELGRFPSNIMFDTEAAALLDEQSGESTSKQAEVSNKGSIWGSENDDILMRGHNDSGGASRFFYVPKASKADRDEGLEGFTLGPPPASARSNPAEGRENALGNPRANHHPTVKPTELMQYLVRLVTPKGGVTLDPFMGSGSTGKAAIREGMCFIGCERGAEYVPISIARINAPAQVGLL